MKLVLASKNAKKLDELRRFLEGQPVEVVLPGDDLPEVIEDRPTFRENAAKKAISAARHTGMLALADDSGLEVEHLKGEPGVRSARWAGAHGDDEANNRHLLEKLKGVPLHKLSLIHI